MSIIRQNITCRSKFQDYYGGAGFGYKLSNTVAFGFSTMVSYKDDQFYNLVNSNAFTMPETDQGTPGQYLSNAAYHVKYNMFDVRLVNQGRAHREKKLMGPGNEYQFSLHQAIRGWHGG